MIRVKKSSKNCPQILKTKGAAETAANIRFISKGQKNKVRFNYYNHTDVVTALETIFNKKCAYCEAKYAAVSPADIEHFRPKSRTIKKGAKKEKFIGYYWLANDWENLLVSCPNCNRPKGHYVPNEKKKITIGKHEQFPLEKEELRWIDPKKSVSLKSEEKVRLLVHPCKDNPEKYFEFDTVGPYPGNILAKKTLTGLQLKKATESIRVYALHRIDLIDERSELHGSIKKDYGTLKREIANYKKAKSAARKKEIKPVIQEYADYLNNYRDARKEYSGFAKQVVGEYFSELNSDLVKIFGKKY